MDGAGKAVARMRCSTTESVRAAGDQAKQTRQLAMVC